jgi:hypothetical protein
MIRHLTQMLVAVFILLFSIRIKISTLKWVNPSLDAHVLPYESSGPHSLILMPCISYVNY